MASAVSISVLSTERNRNLDRRGKIVPSLAKCHTPHRTGHCSAASILRPRESPEAKLVHGKQPEIGENLQQPHPTCHPIVVNRDLQTHSATRNSRMRCGSCTGTSA